MSAKIDHINPASWKGDVYVKNIVILTSWEEGCRLASEELEEVDYIPLIRLWCLYGQNNHTTNTTVVLFWSPPRGVGFQSSLAVFYHLPSNFSADFRPILWLLRRPTL